MDMGSLDEVWRLKGGWVVGVGVGVDCDQVFSY